MSAAVLLLVGVGIGWWGNRAHTWIDEVKSSRVKVRRSRQTRNHSVAMTAIFVGVLVVLIIGFAQGR
jgi:hypothetical protein